ncbi:MAG TPA: hypothetical protein VN950_19045 [Terriglobales bacterium]|nr:hypothetical protein [Terriglobales bacterium]
MKNVIREGTHTRWVTDANMQPFDPSSSVETMTEAQFDRYLRSMKPSEEIQGLMDRVDEIQREAGVFEEVR